MKHEGDVSRRVLLKCREKLVDFAWGTVYDLAVASLSKPRHRRMIRIIALDQRNDFWVIVGGGPVTREYAQDIGSNGWAPDAAVAVQVCDRLLSLETDPADSALIYEAAE